MYESRFGLHRKPFQAVLTSDDFFRSDVYEDLASTVIHALRSDLGVAVLTGPSGIGKTVTLDSIRRAMSAENQVMVLRGGTVSSGEDLLHALHRRLLPPPGKTFEPSVTRGTAAQAARWEVIERMQKVSDFWGPTIVLLDDAHLATPELFVELRALMEEEADGQRLLRVMIAGPLSLEEFLGTPPLQDFSQKIRTHRFLEPLTSAQSVAYLNHQMQRVGGDTAKIFQSKALERIVAAADGVPRCLDLLADESLMAAFRTEQDVVTVAAVDDGLSRLRHLPYAWNVSRFSAEEEVSEGQPTTTAVVSHGVIEVGAPAGDTEPPSSSHAVEIGDDRQSAALPEDDVLREDASVDSPGRPEATVDSDEAAAKFDRIFQSISVGEGGRVAVAPVARRSGAEAGEVGAESSAASAVDVEDVDALPADALLTDVPSADQSQATGSQENGSLNVASEAQSGVVLEHHLVLPQTADSEQLADESPAGTPAEGGASDGVETRSASGKVAAIDRYVPWTPAGTWSEPADGGSASRTVSRSTNASPVFDRYTWCELGRSVGPDPVNRSPVSVTEAAPAQWPPIASGLAPDDEIPVEVIAASGSQATESTVAAVVSLATTEMGDTRGVGEVGQVDPASSIEAIEDLLNMDDERRLPSSDRMFTLPIDVSDVNSREGGQPDQGVRPPATERGPQAALVMESVLAAEERAVDESESAEFGEDGETLQVFRESGAVGTVRRHVVSVSGERMKLAAGAESLSRQTMIAEEDAAERPAPSEGGRGFANLFTRLRRGRRR